MGKKPPWTPVGEAGPKTGPWTAGTPPPASLAPQALPRTWYVQVPTEGLHRGLSGGCELLPRTPSTEAVGQEPSPDKARPAAQESMGNAGLGQLRLSQTPASMSSPPGSETTPSTVAVLLVHQHPPNPSGAWGTASVRRHAARPA